MNLVETDHTRTYKRDGIVLIKGAFEQEWIDLLLAGMRRIETMPKDEICTLPQEFIDADPILEREIAAIRSSNIKERRLYTEQSRGFIRYKYLYWWVPEFREFVSNSPAAKVVAETIGAKTLRFFIDAIFMKQANCDTKTYWHADEPAWPVKGEQVPTMWMPLLPVKAHQSSLEYIAGSHREHVRPYPWPNTFNAKTIERPKDRPDFYDWEQRRNDPEISFLAFDMDPGDVVILHPNLQHGGGANLHPTQPRIAYSTRWFGDDVVWDPRPECVNLPGMPLSKMVRGEPVSGNTALPLLLGA